MTGTPRQYHQQMVHYLRKGITFADNGKTLVVGTLPAGALVLKPLSGVHVVTAFNGTTNVLDIGVTGDTDLFAVDAALGVATFVPAGEAVGGYRVAADIDVIAIVATTGTPSAGEAEVVIAYIPDNDG